MSEFSLIFDIKSAQPLGNAWRNASDLHHIRKTSHEIACEIKKLIKNNIFGHVPPIDLKDFLGTEEVDKFEFINEH